MSEAVPASLEGGPGSLFVFDGYNYIFRAFHALPMLNSPAGVPVNAVHGFVRMVQKVRRQFAPERVLVVFDAGGDGQRREIYPAYKANRPPAPSELVPQFELVRAATTALGLPSVDATAFEADDVIAAYAEAASREGMRVAIVSSDKDLMQLCRGAGAAGGAVVLYDTMKDRTIGPAEVEEKFGVGPARLGDLLALAGDSSDNVPGVPGVGVKTAAALLGEYDDLEGVLAAAPDIPQKKRRERLIEHADAARLSRRLVQLRSDVPLPVPLAQLHDRGADEAAVVAFCEPLGLRTIIRELTTQVAPATPAGSAPGTAVADAGEVLEIIAAGRFSADPSRYRIVDAAALAEVIPTLQHAVTTAEIGLDVLTEGDDPLRAEAVGLSLGGAQGPVFYVPLAWRQAELGSAPALEFDAVRSALASWLADASAAKVVVDAKRVAHALDKLGMVLDGVTFDPMLASYTVDPARTAHDLSALAHDVLSHDTAELVSLTGRGKKAIPLADVAAEALAPLGCERSELAHALTDAIRPQLRAAGPRAESLYHEIEMPLARVLFAVERRGVCVDAEELRQQSRECSATLLELAERIENEAGHPVNLDSPKQLQGLLYEEWGLPAERKIKTGFSTDSNALEKLAALYDPRVRWIIEYRRVHKLKNTYLDALPRLVRPDTGRLHTSFHQAVAATGRLSSSDPNLQNIPVRTPEGRRIRDAFVAPAGRMLVSLDYSQIELRILAHLSGDSNLCSAFRDGVDVHRRTASEVFEVPEAEVTDEQRSIAKAVNFGVIYGQQQHGLAQALGIPRGKAGSYIRAYFEKLPVVREYMEGLIDVARRKGYTETMLGRRRRLPELASRGAAKARGERMARNTPIQGSAADILKLAMIAVERELGDAPWAQMILTVHDELIFECDEARVTELIERARPLMEDALALDVPVRVEAGVGRSWSACKG